MGGTCPEIRMLFTPKPDISGVESQIGKTKTFFAFWLCLLSMGTRKIQKYITSSSYVTCRRHIKEHLSCVYHTEPQQKPSLFLESVFFKNILFPVCPAAVLWCSGSHIYGVSEGQWGLLPGSARCLCRRVNSQTRHRSDALEPQEGPRKVGRTGTPPRTSDNSAWMG